MNVVISKNLIFIISDACGTYLVAIEQAQNISTPDYPLQYRSNLTCTWTITANTNYLVRLETGFVSNDTCCEDLQVCFQKINKNIYIYLYINFEKVGIRQEHKEHCSAYFAAYNSVTNCANKGLKHRLFQKSEPTKCNRGLQ